MDDEPRIPQVGQIVKVIRGRDTNKHAVIIRILDDRYVLIADGDKRKFDQPKKKNLLHLQLYNRISGEVADSIRQSGRVTNGKLRFALAQFLESESAETQEKGE